jgi:hypothetical protein
MKRALWLVNLLFAFSGLLGACTCSRLPDPQVTSRWALAEMEVSHAEVIFDGTVDDIVVSGWPIKPIPGETVSTKTGVLVRFSEVHFYRGTSKNTVVETGLGAGDCGYQFKKGEAYLVFAWIGETGELNTSICTATRLLEDAGTHLRVLKGEPPAPKDLADLRNEDQVLDALTVTANPVCGKVTPPKGAKSDGIKVYVWPEEVLLPFLAGEVDAGLDGSFCLNDLDPGRYFVAARQDARSGTRHVAYYPGVDDRSKAVPVLASDKGPGVRLEFSLNREQLHTVRGYLRGLRTKLSGQLKVILLPSQPSVLNFPEPVDIGSNGLFEITGVPPGHYSAFAVLMNEEKESLTFVSKVAEFDLNANFDGLRLEFVPPSPVN